MNIPTFRKVLEESGATVVSSLDDFTLFKGHSLVIVNNLISPERQQLANIIFISHSILCVSSDWVKFCLEQNKIIAINKFLVCNLTENIISRLNFDRKLLSD